jgi:carbamoyltransferase
LPEVQVFNFGLSGTGTDQQYLIWREHAAQIEHDLVLIAVLVENIRRVVARFRPFQSAEGEDVILAKPYFTLDSDGSLSLHNVPVPREPIPRDALAGEELASVDRGGRLEGLRRAVNRLGPGAKALVQRITRYQPVPGYARADHPDWRLLEAILRGWVRELPGPVVICPVPLYQHIEETSSPKGYQARFRALEDPERVIVHDPLPDFRAHSPEQRRAFRFERDVHLTPAAHRVLAESLAARIGPLVRLARG